MPGRLTRRACVIGASLIALGLLGAMGWLLAQARGLLLADGNALFGDFIAFWSAGRLALEGEAARAHDLLALAPVQKAAVPGLYFLTPWNHPPPFLLIAAPLALAPYPIAALIFLGGSLALYIFAARKLAPGALVFALTAPAALYHLGNVQTGLLIAGLCGLAAHWMERRPRLAGALIGLLVIKPHLALLWPLMLALQARWRVFWFAASSAGALIALSGAAFGLESYARFIDNLPAAASMISAGRAPAQTYASLYGNLLGLGAPHSLAIAAHAALAAFGLAAAIWIWRRANARLSLAALCAAGMLIPPYLFFYDATLLALGAGLMGAPRNRLELAALILCWGAGLSLALGHVLTAPLCPLAASLLLYALMKRGASPGASTAQVSGPP